MGLAKSNGNVEEGVLEEAVDEAIRMAGGDLRAAVRGLILGQESYEAELRKTVSAGYVRRRLSK